MSLFEKLGIAKYAQENNFSDLDLFLGIIEDIQEQHPDQFHEFFEVLTDPRRACLTGSSVLSKRLNKQNLAKDIDIFVDNRDGDFGKILQSFFSKVNVVDIIWPVYQNRVKVLNTNRESFTSDAQVIRTSSSDYDFSIELYKLETFKIRLGQHILLNFILLTDTYPNIKLVRGVNVSWLPSDTNSRGPFMDATLNDLAIHGFITSKEDYQKYSTYLLEYINKSFDFQELKYVYDFRTKTNKNIFEMAEESCNDLINMLTAVESTRFTDNILQRLSGDKLNLIREKEVHRVKYNNPDSVTIASDYQNRFFDVQRVSSLDKEQVMIGKYLQKTANDFTALNYRVDYYQEKGFKVEDPDGIVINLHVNLAAVTLGSLVDPVIHNLERQSIFNSTREEKKKYLFLNRLKGIVEENEEHLGLTLIRPPEKEKEKGEEIDTR